jgi:hypothetical protein
MPAGRCAFPCQRFELVTLVVEQHGALHKVVDEILGVRIEHYGEIPGLCVGGEVQWRYGDRHAVGAALLRRELGLRDTRRNQQGQHRKDQA